MATPTMNPGTRIQFDGQELMVLKDDGPELVCLYGCSVHTVPSDGAVAVDSPELPVALTIGSYRMADFVELNIVMSRLVYGNIPILVSDDLSPESEQIEAVAAKHDCHYLCTTGRMAHCGGDIQHFINAAEFASQEQRPFALKQSCRFIPLPGIEKVWRDGLRSSPLVIPGQIRNGQIARPDAKFYTRFGLLTDCVAWRTGSVTGEDIAQHYRDCASTAKHHWDSFVEIAWGRMIGAKFSSHILESRLANHEVGKPKLYLRKAQSGRNEYEQIATALSIQGTFDVREWKAIEKAGYQCFATKL